MLAKGITRFSRADWTAITGMEKNRMCDACDYLVAHKLVVSLNKSGNRSEYMFTLQEEGPLEEEMVNVEVPNGDYSPVLIARLQKMVTAGSSERDQRIGGFILNMIDNSIERFSTEDWVEAFHVTKPVYTNDLRRAVNFGLLRKENPCGNSTHYTYVVPKGPYEEVRCSDLTKIQRGLLGKIHRHFKKDEFTVRDASRATGCSETSISFHLSNLAERGIMAVHNHPEFPGHAQGYSLAIFPKDQIIRVALCRRLSISPPQREVGISQIGSRLPLRARDVPQAHVAPTFGPVAGSGRLVEERGGFSFCPLQDQHGGSVALCSGENLGADIGVIHQPAVPLQELELPLRGVEVLLFALAGDALVLAPIEEPGGFALPVHDRDTALYVFPAVHAAVSPILLLVSDYAVQFAAVQLG